MNVHAMTKSFQQEVLESYQISNQKELINNCAFPEWS